MKKVKGMILFLLTVCVLAVMPMALKMDVNAESVTYTLKPNDDGQWRYQEGYPWDENEFSRELYYMKEKIKDGDAIVVTETGERLELEVNVRLGNLTIEHATNAVVTAPHIEECYILPNSWCAINGYVSKGEVYDGSTVNFNSNVGTCVVYEKVSANFLGNVECLEVYGEEDPEATIDVFGTVNTLVVQGGTHMDYLIQNIHEGEMEMERGNLKTGNKHFNTKLYGDEAEAMYEFIKTNAIPIATPAAPAAGNGNTSNDYDAVPKTGDTTNAFAWLMAAVAFAVVAVYARKRSTI